MKSPRPAHEVLALSHGLLSPAANALCDGASNIACRQLSAKWRAIPGMTIYMGVLALLQTW